MGKGAESPTFTGLGVVAPPPILIQTPTFEGSLATLFRCVRDQKVDLMTIPLEPVCESYFLYLIQSEHTELDEAAAALAVLAYLLERKAWGLLPVEEMEPEYEEALVLPDPSAYEFAEVIDVLKIWQDERSKLFFRSPEAESNVYEVPYTVGDITVGDLARAFERLLRRAQPDSIELLSKPRKSLQEQMRVVLIALTKEYRPIESLFVGTYTRSDAVYWFLALLELIRLKQAGVRVEEDQVLFAKL